MKGLTCVAAAAVATMAVVAPGQAQVVDKKALTLEGARHIIATAIGEARRLNAPGGVIAVVDDGGNLIALERLDGTFAAGASISIGKARTAAMFKRPTRAFEDIIKNGRTAMVALADFTPLQGGVPLMVGEDVVGGIGVSGAASAQQDEDIALAGAAVARTLKTGMAGPALPRKATFIDSRMVAAGFEKGAVLVNMDNYMVHASHREMDGIAEVHTLDTDLIYILDGAATFVTGGRVPDANVSEPNELRGSAIVGGEGRRVVKGDVIVVPAGVPHMFTEVQGPLNYYVVKVR
ncbi:MAG TPA: heme-binding protein [Methylomirabilota bacterium]|nr:heme-binding protein [Methylomirabilota bacterium]